MALTKISGSVIKDNVSLSGNVSVGGTLTYQDVTNVDALGVGTFRTGINVSGGQIDVGSNIKLGNAGVITATSFVGSGANLTSLPSQIGGAIGADFNDNVKLRLGTGNDLEIYHNGTDNIFDCKNDKNLKIVNDVGGGNETMALFDPNGAVELYHNNVKRFETDSNGARVVAPEGARAELRIIGDEGDDNNDYFKLSAGDGTLKLQDASNGSTWEDNIVINGAGSVELYYDNVKKAETTSSGLKITTTNSATAALQLYNTTQSASTYTINGEGNSFIGHTYPRTDANLDLGFHTGYRWRDLIVSGGVRFGASADAHYLDDYEEGTFTPTNTIGMTLTNNYTAFYTKIGRMVYVHMDVSFSGANDVSQCGLIQSLPFTSSSSHITDGAIQFVSEGTNTGGTSKLDHDDNNMLLKIGTSESRIDIVNLTSGALQTRAYLHGRRFRISMWYTAT